MNLVKRIAENNWMLSIPSNIVYAEHFQEVVKRVPITKLLCETDSPYLSPTKEWPNEPANVIKSYEIIAKFNDKSLKDTADLIAQNYRNIFGD